TTASNSNSRSRGLHEADRLGLGFPHPPPSRRSAGGRGPQGPPREGADRCATAAAPRGDGLRGSALSGPPRRLRAQAATPVAEPGRSAAEAGPGTQTAQAAGLFKTLMQVQENLYVETRDGNSRSPARVGPGRSGRRKEA